MKILQIVRPAILAFILALPLIVASSSEPSRERTPPNPLFLAGAAALKITPTDEQGLVWQEPYTDDNGNGRYDAPDPLNPSATSDHFEDTNHNGKWDGPFLAGY